MKRFGCALLALLLLMPLGHVAAQNVGAVYTVFFDRGDTRTFTVFSSHGGETQVQLSGQAGQGEVAVNGIPQGEWALPADMPLLLALQKGTNTIAFSGGQGIEQVILLDEEAPLACGATTPYQTHEAEDLAYQGELLSGDRAYRTVTSEASGRACVKLATVGDYVELTLSEPANALVIRYCVPDNAEGTGIETEIILTANGADEMTIPLTSRHTWLYGGFPWSNNPADGNAHVFFDDVRVKLERTYEAGETLRLTWNAPADCCIIDLIDTELADAPHEMPENSLSIVDFGAIADDGLDDSGAISACILEAAKQGKEVFIPAGTFEVSNPVLVNGIWLNRPGTVIRGAGMWHTVLTGPYAYFTFKASNIALHDFSLIGRADLRRDTYPTAITSDYNRFDIKYIDVHNIWIEHYNIGLWVNCIDSMHITGCRFRDTYADGINLRRGTKNTVIEQCTFRNNGDDGIAQWSAAVADRNNKVRFNTVALPWLANNIAVYGGADLEITDNLITDTVCFGGGVNISSKFEPQPFEGTILVARNTFLRAGSRDWDIPKDYGAIWVNTVAGHDNDAAVIIADNIILDSTYYSIAFTGSAAASNIRIENNRLDAPIHVDAEARGAATLADNTGGVEIINLAGEGFSID